MGSLKEQVRKVNMSSDTKQGDAETISDVSHDNNREKPGGNEKTDFARDIKKALNRNTGHGQVSQNNMFVETEKIKSKRADTERAKNVEPNNRLTIESRKKRILDTLSENEIIQILEANQKINHRDAVKEAKIEQIKEVSGNRMEIVDPNNFKVTNSDKMQSLDIVIKKDIIGKALNERGG